MYTTLIKWDNVVARFLKSIFFIIFNIISLPFVIIIFCIYALKNLIFVCIMDDRIGHLAGDTHILLNRIKQGLEGNYKFIGIASTSPANKQLLKMFRREMKIYCVPRFIWNFCHYILSNKKSAFYIFCIFEEFHVEINRYYDTDITDPIISFTEDEENKGKQLLKKMGLKEGDWFVCFHAREKGFVYDPKGIHDFRNWDINTAIPAMKYIAEQGGYAIRIGAKVNEKIPESDKVIDYATKYRTDFGDVYLAAKCKFFVGEGCGINQVSQVFNVPEAWVNGYGIENPPRSEQGLYIIKRMFSHKKNRLLTFKETLGRKLGNLFRTKDFELNEVYLIPNTEEEIKELVVEMNEKLNGKDITDKEAQNNFKKLFPKSSLCYGFKSNIGTKFLLESISYEKSRKAN